MEPNGTASPPPVGLETAHNSAEIEERRKNGAKSGARDHDLARVITGWEKLDDATKTVILRLIGPAAPEEIDGAQKSPGSL